MFVVPTAPRGLQLMLQQEEPPVVSVTWQAPRNTHGALDGFKLSYGIAGDSEVDERRFDAEKVRFTTGFLGKWLTIN